ncbi:hypothetical protein, partial [Carboxylicivirga sp. RSCT41]|uniref:hypothetical protein n=1 Tax=Carboxylicivirga agarovorans TaxID=3417570 RepID=UPI003D343119
KKDLKPPPLSFVEVLLLARRRADLQLAKHYICECLNLFEHSWDVAPGFDVKGFDFLDFPFSLNLMTLHPSHLWDSVRTGRLLVAANDHHYQACHNHK